MPEPIIPAAPAPEGGEGSPAGTPNQPEPNQPTEVELARRRQAGAEKARQEAEAQLAAAKAELDRARSAKPGEAPAFDPDAFAKSLRAELRKEFDEELNKRTAAVEGRALDAKFPVARAKFPEVTDPVKLAELEGFFGSDTTPETPKPVGNNPARGTEGGKNIEDMTSKELQAYMRTLDPSVMGLPSKT